MEEEMTIMNMAPHLLKALKRFQANESMGYEVYRRLSEDPRLSFDNAETLRKIAEHEKTHVEILAKYLGPEVSKPSRIERMLLRSRILGFTFTLKRMEMIQARVMSKAIRQELIQVIPELDFIFQEEDMIDMDLLSLLDEERLVYVSSIVLGLNDALVELSGAIAGFTFAMRNNRLIALAGIITGISASLSMAASEFLSTRADGNHSKKTPGKAALITGIAYVLTVSLMVLPYILLAEDQYFISLAIMLGVVICVIAVFSFYVSVTRAESFKKQFGVMAAISLSVAFASFVIGILVKNALGIEI